MHVNGSSGRRSDLPEDKEATFENAGDLKFSDLGPPPERVATEEGNARRLAADAEAVWNATCPKCGAHMVGTRDTLIIHECGYVSPK